MSRSLPKAPAEGWISLVLVLVMCLTLAWSIDDVRLVLGNDGYTDFLAPMAILGVLIGFIGAKVGWGRWLTYLIGAVLAALIVPLVVGVQLPYDPALGYIDAFRQSGATWAKAIIELTVLGKGSTGEYGHYMIFLGLLVWATSMFAGYAVFGHRRPLNAIVVVGLLLLVNMALTPADQVGYLVMFSIAALALLVRFHILDEQAEWVRRRIGDPASISAVYLRGGSVFIGVAIVGSLLLMNVARSAPLEGSWTGFSGAFVELSRSIQRFVPVGGNSRAIGSDFDPSSTKISGKWLPNDRVVATVKLPVTDKTDYYWRATTFDEFVLNEWISSALPEERVPVDAGKPLLLGTEEAANRLGVDTDGTALGTTDITFTVEPAGGDPILLSPLTPLTVDVPTDVSLIGEPGTINAILRRDGGPYTVTARVRLTGSDPGEFSIAALRNAGTDYPEDIEARFTDLPDGAIPEGGAAQALLDRLIEEGPGTENPYDFAAYLQQRFVPSVENGGLFTYDPDILDLMDRECKDISVVECFAEYKRGSCQFYASTMAIFLREEGIPARVVEGFLPSQRSPQGVEVINGTGQHQWVEVYFPGYGWYGFDPTGGGRSRQELLPLGVAGPSLPPLAAGALPQPTRREDTEPDDSGATGNTRTRIPVGGLIAVGLLLAVIVGGLAFVAWQRGPRSGTSADGAYRTVTRLAARFGFGPRPDQTVYEYAGTLGEVLPAMRPELETVARAKVETAYGRGLLGNDRLLALRQAERRLRLNLLRLAFRRKDRRRR